jgi:hypothetical protein
MKVVGTSSVLQGEMSRHDELRVKKQVERNHPEGIWGWKEREQLTLCLNRRGPVALQQTCPPKLVSNDSKNSLQRNLELRDQVQAGRESASGS